MNRRDALTVMGGTVALCLLPKNLIAATPPVAKFEEVVFDCPPKMTPIFGAGSTISQPRLVNGDEILGEWKPEHYPSLDFHASLLDSFDIPFPLPYPKKLVKGYFQRSNHVIVEEKDGFLWVNENNVLIKIHGLVEMTQVRFINKDGMSQVTGVRQLNS